MMHISISIPSLKMLMSGCGGVVKFTGSSSSTSTTKRIEKPLFFTSSSAASPTLNLVSFVLSTILVIHLVMSINGASGHPLEARLRAEDITESNNNLLKWWVVTSGEVAARQMNMDSPLGAEAEEEGEQIKGLDLQEADDDDDDDDNELPGLQASSRSNQNQRSGLSEMRYLHSRSKKGLSYLSKFYSEALLHHNGGNVGNNSGSSSKEAQYYGERHGYGGGSGGRSSAAIITNFPSSGEHSRFPANVRRKLSFYPPLTLMSPWRSILSGSSHSGRNTAMRLRWGK